MENENHNSVPLPPPAETVDCSQTEIVNPYAVLPTAVPIVITTVVQTKPPALWPVVVVGLAVIPVALIVSFSAVILAMIGDLGFSIGSASGVQQWLDDFTMTRHGLFVLVVPGQVVFLSAGLGAACCSSQGVIKRLRLGAGRMPMWTWLFLASATPMIGYVTSFILSLFVSDMGESLRLLQNIFKAHGGSYVGVLVLMVAVLPGFSEEVLFRGYIQSRLLKRLPALVAIFISSLIFGAAHLDPVHAIAVVPLGMWLGVVAWRCDSIWPAVCGHIINNSLAIVATQMGTAESFAIETDVVTVVTGLLSGAALVVSIVLMIWEPRKTVSLQ